MVADLYIAEPPAVFALRPPLVVDASFVAAIVFAELEMDAAGSRLIGYTPVAPTLLDFEMANIAVVKVLRRSLTLDEATNAMTNFFDLPIERLRVDGTALVALAQRYGLTAYDAAYLWLAAAIPAPLATFDKTLALAAREHLASGTGSNP